LGGPGACPVYPLKFALATTYRLLCEQEATGGEPVGWQRWRLQLFEPTRDLVIVCAQGCYGNFHMAEFSLLVGVRIKDRPPGIDTCQQVQAKCGLTAHGCTLCQNLSKDFVDILQRSADNCRQRISLMPMKD
jgi:hypothetical protein